LAQIHTKEKGSFQFPPIGSSRISLSQELRSGQVEGGGFFFTQSGGEGNPTKRGWKKGGARTAGHLLKVLGTGKSRRDYKETGPVYQR